MAPAFLMISVFVMFVSTSMPMAEQSGGRYGKIVAQSQPIPEPPVFDDSAQETSLEEEVDDAMPDVSEHKLSRSWNTRVKEISRKLLDRFTADIGMTTSTVAKAFGRASAAMQGLHFPAGSFLTTVLAVIIGSSPIARTIGDGIGILIADVLSGAMGMFMSRGVVQENDFHKDYPVFYQNRYKRDLVDESVVQDFVNFASELAGYALDVFEEKFV